MTGILMLSKNDGVSKGYNEMENQNNLSLVDFILTALRRSMVACRVDREQDVISAVHKMEIGWPTNVQHIAHVTFDRFNGFLGLPIEFQVEVPCKAPSASVSVFGVSAESMQCSYDSRGNSVPTILLLMQKKLYSQDGLKAEGIFRINPENSKEEIVRSQLNRGIVPEDIDVHCLAGLIKAWFRELPSGILDGLSPEQVLECNTEEESVELVENLKPTEAALLSWAVDLMADVVELQDFNKMNPRNIAMVFAPNMTQMSDPLTALMHAVQVMNLLKTLIIRTLREREDAETDESYSPMGSSHFSSDIQTENEIYSPENIESSCELRVPMSESDENISETDEEDDVNLLNEMEDSFLQQLNEMNNQENTSSLKETIDDFSIQGASDDEESEENGIENKLCDKIEDVDMIDEFPEHDFPLHLLRVQE